MNDLAAVTGSRAVSAYGEHVAGDLAGDLAKSEHVLVAGAPMETRPLYTLRPFRWFDTITVLAGSVDFPTRADIVTCRNGWVVWVRWSVSFLPARCRCDVGS